jgi:hypothetical protein
MSSSGSSSRCGALAARRCGNSNTTCPRALSVKRPAPAAGAKDRRHLTRTPTGARGGYTELARSGANSRTNETIVSTYAAGCAACGPWPTPAIIFACAFGRTRESISILNRNKARLFSPAVSKVGAVKLLRVWRSTRPASGSRCSSRNVGALKIHRWRTSSGRCSHDPALMTVSTNCRAPASICPLPVDRRLHGAEGPRQSIQANSARGTFQRARGHESTSCGQDAAGQPRGEGR